MRARTFTAGFLFAGLGAGARGFLEACARLGEHQARFRCVGGIDNDPLALEDFAALTGGPTLCADVAVTRQRIVDTFRRLAVERHPDHGGTDALMAELNCARDQALAHVAAGEGEEARP